ncbi:MAG TPA: E2/UBC family protein [Polyangiaceae bacterium]|jgi:hypothetical protein
MKEAVARAVEEIKAAFPNNDAFPKDRVVVKEDDQGGAWVIVEDADVGELYEAPKSWIGFRITFQYPNADVYPHFVRSDLLRKDKRALGEATQGGQNFMGRPAIQLSRKSNRLNPATDTALLKLVKVLHWLSTHP